MARQTPPPLAMLALAVFFSSAVAAIEYAPARTILASNKYSFVPATNSILFGNAYSVTWGPTGITSAVDSHGTPLKVVNRPDGSVAVDKAYAAYANGTLIGPGIVIAINGPTAGFTMGKTTFLKSGKIVDASGKPVVPTVNEDGSYTAGDLTGWNNDGTIVGPTGASIYLGAPLTINPDGTVTFPSNSAPSAAPSAPAPPPLPKAWLTRDAAARLAVRNHLPLAERAHFGQHKTAKALYNAVVARYSSPATAALGRLILTNLFPELSAFATVEDLVTHLRTTTLAIVLPSQPSSSTGTRPRSETSVVNVGAARDTPRTPFFEGCSPSPLAPSYASAAAIDILGAEDVRAASALSGKPRISKGNGGKSGRGGSGGGGGGGSGGSGGGGGGGGGGIGGGGGSGGGGGGRGGSSGNGGGGSGGGRGGAVERKGSGGDRAGQICGKFHTQHRCFSCLDDAWRTEFGDKAELPRWLELLRSGVDIFALDYDDILVAMYALSVSAEGDCYLCVPPDPGIEAAALGASESALPGIAPAEALHTFTLDLGASCFHTSSRELDIEVPELIKLSLHGITLVDLHRMELSLEHHHHRFAAGGMNILQYFQCLGTTLDILDEMLDVVELVR
ncbi:unnamed protein product [Closterium sp. NIES-53]